MQQPRRIIRALQNNIGKVIVGKEDVVELALIAMLCGGHVLIEDVPGVGKTTLCSALAKSLACSFKRIQFTPDVTPSDVTGYSMANLRTGELEFRPGAVMSQIVLADEINRTSPKTQSSLLEAMEERQITIDGATMQLDEPFMVMATQNPLESYGTFPLPEAQIDRFFMRLSLGYMQREQELGVMARRSTLDIVEGLEQVVSLEETAWVRDHVRDVTVSDEVKGYIMDIVQQTRSESRFITGVSTRGAIALYKAVQAKSAFEGRDYALPEDVQAMAVPVLAHRLASGGQKGAQDSALWLRKLMSGVRVPLEDLTEERARKAPPMDVL